MTLPYHDRNNLGCVYARAGRIPDALATLAKAGDLRAQNPHPEADTDRQPLWELPEFVALLRSDAEVHADTPLDTLELSVRATETLEMLGVEIVGELLAIEDATELPRAIVNELDLGDVYALQVFADLEGDFYEDSYHAVVMHREVCPAVLDAPVGVDVTPVWRSASLLPLDRQRSRWMLVTFRVGAARHDRGAMTRFRIERTPREGCAVLRH